MNQNIKDLLLSNNEDDIKLGVELLYREEPELFVYENTAEYTAYLRPLKLNAFTGKIGIVNCEIFNLYAEQNNYFSIKGQDD